jgi:hypothetical protein
MKDDDPRFFDTPGVDALLQMVMALAAELSAVTEEVDTLRELLLESGQVSAAALASFSAADERSKARAARRDALVRALMAPLETEAQALAAAQGVTP